MEVDFIEVNSSFLSQQMQQQKKHKIFVLARGLKSYLSNKENSLPKHPKLDKLATSPSPSPQNRNMFNEEIHEKGQAIRIDNEKSYQLVGVRELKAYHERVKQNNKEKRRDTYSVKLSSISISAIVEAKSKDVLTSEQILNKIYKNTSPHNQKNHLLTFNEENTQSIIQNQSEEIVFCINNYPKGQVETTKISRIKEKHTNYQSFWKKNSRTAEKLSCILQQLSSSRLKTEAKELNQMRLKQKNSNFRDRNLNLRCDPKLAEIEEKYVIRIKNKDQGGYCLQGKGKLEEEISWLNNKKSEGYLFRELEQKKDEKK